MTTIAPQLITLTTAPPWLPLSLHQRPAPVRINFRFSAAERRVFRKRRKIRVSEWCEKHRVLTMSSLAGPWRNEITPYLAGIMDASFFVSVREISLCKSPQTGGSEGVNNCIGYAADRDPGPVMYVYPDQEVSKENCNDRIQPMFTSSRRLRETMTGRQDDASAMRINLKHMPIYMAWARSVSRLSNKPIRYIVFDETDKYPPSNNRETDPIRLGEARKTTYRWNYKIWKISTPSVESGYIWQALLSGQVIFEYRVRCPLCSGDKVMSFEQIRFPDDERDPNIIEAQGLAWYECEHCSAKWDDHQRDQAVRLGGWVSKGTECLELFAYLEKYRPRKIGFHLPSWLSPFVPLAEIAAAWLKCRQPGSKAIDLNAHKDFCNRYKSEPWFEYRQDRKEDTILALRDDRPAGQVPGGNRVAALVAGVDTQKNGFWYKIVAIGYGLAPNVWVIRYGFVESFDNLAAVLWQDQYRDAEGNPYLVEFVVQDAMGEKTSEVYDFCIGRRGRILPSKGEKTKQQPFTYGNLEYYPNSSKPIPGGLKLVNVNTQFFKDQLAAKLEVGPTDPGAWRLHQESDQQADLYAAQMVVEYRDDAGFWQCPSGKANHLWDCGVLCLVAAEIRRLKYRPIPAAEQAPAVKQSPPVRSKFMTR